MLITSHLFEAYLKCHTKCFLRSLGETTTENCYSDWVQDQQASYRSEEIRRLTQGATASRLRSHSRKDENAILLPREPGGLDVKVSGGTLDRALQVMAQVVAVLERQGFGVNVSEQGRTAALINGEYVSFGIEEPIRRIVTQKPRV